jgi:hypothetical protein
MPSEFSGTMRNDFRAKVGVRKTFGGVLMQDVATGLFVLLKFFT